MLTRENTLPHKNGLLQAVWRLLRGVLVAVGLITLIVMVTPINRWWAHAYSGPINQPKGDILILLSAANDDQGILSYSSYWRARYALLAWQSGGFKTVVISGGGGPGIRDFLINGGVPPDVILSEWQSKTTRENAINTIRLVQGMQGSKVLLTSDFHMFRAVRVFRKLGLEVEPDPVPDVMKRGQDWYARFSGFEVMVTETAKIVDYRIHGWI